MSITRTSSQPWELLLLLQGGLMFAQQDRVFVYVLSYRYFLSGSGLSSTFCSTGAVTRDRQFGPRDKHRKRIHVASRMEVGPRWCLTR